MKVIYISYVEILSVGGAPIEARKFYNALKYCKTMIKDFDFKVISLDKDLPEKLEDVELVFDKFDSIRSRIAGHSYYMYTWWNRNKKIVMRYNPDIVILGRSNLGFIAYDLKRCFPNVIVMTDVDNIEIDYLEAFKVDSTNIIKRIMNEQLRRVSLKDEQKSVEYSDFLFFLTPRNLDRAKELYNYDSNNKHTILPICVSPAKEKLIHNTSKAVTFYGNLNYEANHSSIIDFIENVWTPYFSEYTDIRLLIAGKSPRDELKQKIQQIHNIELYGDYKKMSDFMPEGALAIAPLQKGAGMKTKVAEALSMGLLVVASDEGLVGYEECSEVEGVWRANSVEEYVNVINKYIGIKEDQHILISKRNKELARKYYSQDRANQELFNIFNDMNKS